MSRALKWLPRLTIVAVYGSLASIGLVKASLYLNGRELDWVIFHRAASSIATGTDLYDAGGPTGYIYPPLFAVAIQPLASLSVAASGALWVVINTVLVALAVHLLAARLSGLTTAIPRLWAYGIIAAVTVAAVGEQIASVLRNGQTDALILLAIVLALCLVRFGSAWSGALIALAVAIKYHAILFLALFLVRRQGMAAVALVGGTAVLFALPVLSLGWELNARYLGAALGGLSRMVGLGAPGDGVANIHAMQWPRSVSITSAVARAVGSIHLAIPVLAGVALAIGGVVALLYRRGGINPFWRPGAVVGRDALSLILMVEAAFIVTAILIFGPQTTNRHMILAAIPIAVCVAMLLILGRGVLAIAGGAAIALFVAANALPPSDWVVARTAWRSVGGASWALLIVQLVATAACVEVLRARRRATAGDGGGPGS